MSTGHGAVAVGKATAGLALHWPCVRLCGTSTSGLSGLRKEDLTDEDILSVIILGKHNPTATDPRPLLVKFADRTSKNLLMENL